MVGRSLRDPCINRLQVIWPNMKTTKIEIPTYNPDAEVECDFNNCYELTLQEAEGLRVVMGDPDDNDAPDVLIERAADKWRVFVHPDRSDPLCIIEIQKGRTTIEDEFGCLLVERYQR